MYANLKANLDRKGISVSAAAKLLGMPDATFRTKLNDRSFSVDEAFEVKKHLFPELDVFYLFEKKDTSA